MNPVSASLLDDLRDGLATPPGTTPEVLERYGHDFGGRVRRVPSVVVYARTEAEVLHTLQVARAHRVPLTVRGSGHSSGGQSLGEGGILLENQADAGEVRLLGADRVEVSARARWGQVEAVLQAAGRTMPVLTSSLGTTVGGTLSVGGIGSRSLHHGLQGDHVERVRLLLPEGSARWCGPDEDPELFRFSLSGLGQVGILERVVMRTLPAQPFTRLQLNPHPSLTALVEEVAWTEHWTRPEPEHFFGIWKEGQWWSVFGRDFPDEATAARTPAPEPLRRLTTGLAELDAPPQVLALSEEVDTHQAAPTHRRLWCDYCFDLEGLRRFARFLEHQGPRALRGLNTAYLLALANPARGLRGPFDPRPGPRGAGRVYSLGLYFGVRAEDREGWERAEAAHQRCLEWTLAEGGRPYLYGRNRLTPPQLEALYGADLERLRVLRRSLDPDGLLNPWALSPDRD